MTDKVKVALINHGCAKNLVDSELMLGILDDAGFEITLEDSIADVVIVNTCSFIHDAEKESVQSVLNAVLSGKKVIVTGCLPQKHKEELKEAIPEIAALLGTADYCKIAEVVKRVVKSDDFVYEIAQNPCYKYVEDATRQQITVGSSSYVKIADGCNFKCGYCIIPQLRGAYQSRPIENIVKEVELLAEKGVAEVVLIAQDTTSYGVDLYGKPKLAELLRKLNGVENLDWIRIMYAYPTMFDDDLINAVRDCEKVVKYLDIPLQHSSPKMLKLMSRPVIDCGKLIKKLRKEIPGLALRTTFIVGYPQETEEDFEHLYNFVKEARFDRLGVFEYSKEKNTYSYGLKGHIPSTVKKKRKNAVMKLQKGISKEINNSLVDKDIWCIAEAVTDDGVIVARTYKDAPEVDGLIYVSSEEMLVPGDVFKARVTKADAYDLYGVAITK